MSSVENNSETNEESSKPRAGFLGFVFSRFFLVNILAAILFTVLVAVVALQMLRAYTDHNKYITVPDLKGMSLEQADKMLDGKNLRVAVSDSLYDPRELPYTVLGQYPEFGEEVKRERVVHLTVNKTKPQMVEVPVEEVLEKTLRSVQFNLQGKGFRIGELIYQPGRYDNQVLSLRKSGEKESIEQGTKLPKGTIIDLVVTDGYGNTRVNLPDLSGMSLSEARFVLRANNLVEGNAVFESGADSVTAKVYRQNPDPLDNQTVKAGSMINIWLSEDRLPVDGGDNLEAPQSDQ